MKICKFCNVENENDAVSCSSCGSKDFKKKCPNCGTVYENGNFCSVCGVRADAKAKICPSCGCKYFSSACPECGYRAEGQASKTAYGGQDTPLVIWEIANPDIKPEEAQNSSGKKSKASQNKKLKTVLWVMGWIMIFPIPLTILIRRNEKIKKFWKVVLIILVWLVYLGIYWGSAKSAEADPGSTASQSTAAVQSE